MAARRQKFRGVIPEAQGERSAALEALKAARAGQSIEALISEYTDLDAAISERAQQTKTLTLTLTAVEALLREKIEAADLDAVVAGGYKWTPGVKTYASPGSTRDLVEFFAEHGMIDHLTLLPSKVQAIINEEADQNELVIEVLEVDGVERTIVKSSRLPNVQVFLKNTLSRTKSL